jgi:hypothetical protein
MTPVVAIMSFATYCAVTTEGKKLLQVGALLAGGRSAV